MLEVNETKLAPAVLICIMAFAVVSGIGFAVSQVIIHGAPEPSGNSTIDQRVWKGWIQKSQLQGDPIGDPRPNKLGR